MEGYVIAEMDEETGAPVGYWNGTVLQEELGSANLFTTKDDARFRFGQIQAQYPMKEIALAPARQTVELIAPARSATR